MAETKQGPVPAKQMPAAPTAHGTTEVGHAQPVHEKGVFPPFDPTFFASQLLWLALSFGVFFIVMSRVAVPRIAGVLDARKDKIERDLGEAARLKSETDSAIAAYEKAMTDARQRASVIAAETRAALTADVEARRHAADAALNAKMVAAETQITTIKDQALAEVGGIARETAQAIVAALSTAHVTPDEIASAVDHALAR